MKMAFFFCLLFWEALIPFFQDSPAFSLHANFVRVPVSVFDPEGHMVGGLTADDFELYDEGERTPIRNFVKDLRAVHVVFLLDTSGSIKEEMEEIRRAAFQFASSFEREDRFAVVAFSEEIRLLQDWTGDLSALNRSLKDLKRGYRTALYDALFSTAVEKLRKVSGRKVILLFTDGLDNQSYADYQKAMEGLIRSNVSLYIVSRTRLIRPDVEESKRVRYLNEVMKEVLGEDEDFIEIYFRQKEASMEQLAATTGGRVLYPQKLPDLAKRYAEIASELKSQYLLAFQPPASSSKRLRTIEVKLKNHQGKIAHRQFYLSP